MDLLAAYVSDNDEEDEDAASVPSLNNSQARKRVKLDEGGAKADKVMGFQQLPSAEDMLSDLAPTDLSTVTFKQHTVAAPLLQMSAPATTQTHFQLVELCASLELPPEPPRIRNFPHVEGNFATTVYITADARAQAKLSALTSSLLSSCGKAFVSNVPAVDQPAPHADSTAVSHAPPSTSMQQPTCVHLWPTFPWKSAASAQDTTTMPQHNGTADPSNQQPQQLPIHMSVSRTVPIRRCQIESLQAALVKQLKPLKACRVCLHGLVCLVNDSKTRSFVGLKMSLGQHKIIASMVKMVNLRFAQVVSLIKAVDKAFVMHGLQTFYQEPLPHVSLAWSPGDMTAALQPWLDCLEHEPVPLQVCQVVCQVGKLRHVVWQG